MESRQLTPVLLVGAPLRFENRLFNCAVVIYRGLVLGIVPKTYLPSYREFYETRQFSAARHAVGGEVQFLGTHGAIWQRSSVQGWDYYCG